MLNTFARGLHFNQTPNRLRLWLCLITDGGGTVSKNVRLPQFKKSAA